MFSVGIFTTHIPYLVLISFYTYFLIFGIKGAEEGKIKIAEKSLTVQIHVDNSGEIIADKTYCFYTINNTIRETYILENYAVKQKWKHYGIPKITSQDYSNNKLFGRPPPVLA